MVNHWLFLSDPGSYHYDQLFRKSCEVWDGVHGAAAQRYIAQIRKGDRILGYHTAPEKSVCCVLEAVSAPYQNPEKKDKTLVVDVRGVEKLPRPVPLAELKKNRVLKRMKLFRFFRPIAVSPLTAVEFKEILRLGNAR
ncbi:MAG: EVE domain-containing protein [Acidobacteria bacterium]|nr:EVE domain-containing protein [Acidobacteriota bacterium]